MRGINILLFLSPALRLIRFLWSKRRLWTDKPTRDLRYLIAASVPLGLLVHLTLFVHHTGGWAQVFEGGFRRPYENGKLVWSLIYLVMASFWFGYAYFYLLIQQLKFRSRTALTVVLLTALVLMVVDILRYVIAVGDNSGLVWLLVPIMFFLPVVLVGMFVARQVEEIWASKTDDERSGELA